MKIQLAGGSVIGKEHRHAGRNSQDAYQFRQDNSYTVAVVTDGCGSGRYSEVGAQIGCRLLTETIMIQLKRSPTAPFSTRSFWERIRQDVLANIRVLANQLGGSLSEIINEYFLFTIVGVAIHPESAAFFSIGDGIIIVNDRITELGPFPNNAPPYLAYELTGSTLYQEEPNPFHFKVIEVCPVGELESFLIGTDGVYELISAEEKPLPGLQRVVGPISQFWEDNTCVMNPDVIRRRLFLANREMASPDWEKHSLNRELGHLVDDTTLIVGRQERSE